MKQETMQQSREQLEEAFSALGGQKKNSHHTLYVIIFALVMLIVGLVLGGIFGYGIAKPDEEAIEQDSIQRQAMNLMNQVSDIDSAAQISVVVNDTLHTYIIIKKDTVK